MTKVQQTVVRSLLDMLSIFSAIHCRVWLVLACAGLPCLPTYGAVLSWSGGSASSGNWSDSGNWGFAGVPQSGDTLIFSAGQPRVLNTNNISSLVLNQVRFVGAGGGYDIRGNAFTLTNSIMATNTAGANTIENNITLAGTDQVVDVISSLTLSGSLNGSVGVMKNGAGSLTYSGSSNPYTGTTTVNAGTLLLSCGAYDLAFDGPLVIGDGSSSATVRLLLSYEIPNDVPITVNNNATLDLNNLNDDIGTNLTLNGYAIVQTGTATLTLSPNSFITYTGAGHYINGNLNIGSGTCTLAENDYNFTWMYASVRGSAGIVKVGPGGVVLTASNSFTGPLTINDGIVYVWNSRACGATNGAVTVNNSARLSPGTDINVANKALNVNSTSGQAIFVYTGSNVWSRNITLGTGVYIEVDTGCALRLDGPIGGPGGFTGIGSGILVLSGAGGNTYAGTTIVNSGTTLLLNKSAYNGAIPSNLVVDGTVRLGANEQIADAADVLINGSGLFDFSSYYESINTLHGTGGVTFGTWGYLMIGSAGGTSTFDGIMSGTGYVGGFTVGKYGSGTFTMNGNNTYQNGSDVFGGTMLINGNQPQSPVREVDPEATLGGSGTVGDIPNYCYGTISPGNSPGILTCSNVILTSSATLKAELTGPTPGAGGYDQLNARGTINLASASLTVVPAFTTPVALGQQFVIINNDLSDAITGTFSGLPGGSTITAGNYRFTISYTGGSGNDVVLTLTSIPGAASGSIVTSGNGNRVIDPNECSDLKLVITNTTGTPMTGIFAALSSGDPNVLITQPASTYAGIAASGKGTNAIPFQISVLPSLAPGSVINLNLAVTTASHGAFIVPVAIQSGEAAASAARFDNNTTTSIPDVGFVDSTNVVSGFTGPIMKVGVSLYITHAYDGDLTNISLIAPDGTTVLLSAANGGGGQNYGSGTADGSRTVFDDAAATSIASGTAPFVGTFRPQSPLSALNYNAAPNGNWRLHIADGYGGSLGTLRAWSLFLYPVASFTGGGACALCPDGTLYTNTLTSSSAQQTGRLTRNGIVSNCGSPKSYPGLNDSAPRYYAAYPFYNGGGSACITVTLTSSGGCDQFSAAYLGSFNPTNLAENYLADAGVSTVGASTANSFDVPANSVFIVTVNQVGSGALCGSPYTLAVSGGDCTPNLNIAPVSSTNVNVNWPTVAGGYKLEATTSLAYTNWTATTNEPFASASRFNVTNTMNHTNWFYRLHKP